MLRRLPIVISFAFTIAALICTVQVKQAKFNLPTSHLRNTTLPLKGYKHQGRANVFDTVQSKLQSVASLAATAVPSAVTNALDEVEIVVNSKIPKNCTLGTRYICVGFNDSIDCSPLPLKSSRLVSSILSSLPVEQIQSLSQHLDKLDSALSASISRDLRSYFVFGLVSAVLAVTLGFLSLFLIGVPNAVIFSLNKSPVPVLQAFLSLSCLLAFSIPSSSLWALPPKLSELPFNVEQGEAAKLGTGAFALAGSMFSFAVASCVVARCSGSN
ncbi:hypothetical protein B0J11DRAFT_508385 [Dendryphion nanum]|uniref:Uncharacterized protein n=1 Tax=Dendryphion nanum TaxID=256645 RepID=A0A9P9DHY6_9PLEO|nr:hypothetical protein B0J11DRAFT_508385 [Dendryphion nanum]